MLKLIIHDDEGHKTVVPFVREEITIGRQDGNTIRLTERNVSRRHARLLRNNGHVLVEDLGSYNGIRLNGEKIDGQVAVQSGDLIQIGDYDLAIEQDSVKPAPRGTGETQELPRSAIDEAIDDAIEDATGDILSSSAENPTEAETEINSPIAKLFDEPTASRREPAAQAPPAAADAESDAHRRPTAVVHRDALGTSHPRSAKEIDLAEAPRLVVVSSTFKGQEFACVRNELRIGRTDDNDIPIDHRSLSRTHAKLVRENSGDWRVLDLQSANGITVNGKSCAEATLKSGDVIQLGEVKLKLVVPGQKQPGGGKGLWAGVVVLALLAIGGGLFGSGALDPMLRGRGGVQTTANDPTPVGGAPMEPAAVDPQKALREAQAAVATRTFERAVTLLEAIADPRPPEAEKLLDLARGEHAVQQHLAKAEQAIETEDLETAEDHLAETARTGAFVAERDALKARLSEARSAQDKNQLTASAKAAAEARAAAIAKAEAKAAAEARADAKANAKADAKAAAEEKAAADAKARADAQAAAKAKSDAGKQLDVKSASAVKDERTAQLARFYSDATENFRANKYKQTEQVLRRCVAFDETYAPCHMLLGSTYAKLQQFETGLRHYKRFLELAPESPYAAQVKKLVTDYEASKQR